VCWNKQAVYLGLYCQDIVEDAFYRDKIVPQSDRAEWVVALGGASQPIRARIGAKANPTVDEPAARIVNLSGLNLDVRNIAAMELPARLFGKDKFRAGNQIEFVSTLLTHCRGYRIEWSGKFTLSSDLSITTGQNKPSNQSNQGR
jgi:hypothetical protein